MIIDNIKISEEVYNMCVEFANKSADSSADKYAKRNQKNIEKIKKDIRNGKIAEQIVYDTLKEKFADLTAPDYNVYDKKEKNWSPDLKTEKLNIAVKSQDFESAMHYGDSWVFQFGNGKFDCDKKVFKEKDENHFVCFVSLNVAKRTAKIQAIVKVDWLHQNSLFKEMKLEYLRGNKVAVYLDDLVKHKNINQLYTEKTNE